MPLKGLSGEAKDNDFGRKKQDGGSRPDGGEEEMFHAKM